MMHRKIGGLQIFSLVFFLSHFFFLFFGNHIIKLSQNDTIFACILGVFINILLFKLFLIARKRWSDQQHFPKLIRYMLIFLLSIFSFLILLQTAKFIKINFLEQGSILEISILLVMITLIISKRTTNQVTSLSLLCFFIFIIFFLSNVLGMVSHLTFRYLKPPFITGIIPLIKGALLFSFYTMFPLLLLWFIPYQDVDQRKKQNKYLYFALIISNLVTIIQYMMLAFGPSLNAAATYQYPYMLIIHKISSFLVLDRISYLISIYVLFDSTIVLGLLFTTIKKLFADTYNPYQKTKQTVFSNH